MKAKDMLLSIREELAPVNEKILNHPFIGDAEKGVLALGKIKLFVTQQYYIVSHDIKSLALMLHRARQRSEVDYFNKLLQGDLYALNNLLAMAKALNVHINELEKGEPASEAVAYTHYIAWLAAHATPGEQVFALIVNLPVWGSNCDRLSKILKSKYNILETGFLDAFSKVPGWVEEEGLNIINRYLPTFEREMRIAARMIQAYELMFWNGIYR
jgi:thiaminase